MNGKIICINKSLHKVLLDNGNIIDTTVRGKLRNNHVFPLVGDNVLVDTNNKQILEIKDRKNSLERPLIANIDKLFIVMSNKIPEFSSYLIDKFLLISKYNNIEPIIIITKMDLLNELEKEEVFKYINYYKKLNLKIYLNTEIDKIKKELTNSIVALCGQTGAGKSTLLNKIDPNLKLKTGEVSESLGRGKHTTRLVELISMDNGLIADTPGFSSLELNIPKKEIRFYYDDFDSNCKYNKSCLHIKEDGCSIIEDVNNNKIPLWRYNNYLKFMEETKNDNKCFNTIK